MTTVVTAVIATLALLLALRNFRRLQQLTRLQHGTVRLVIDEYQFANTEAARLRAVEDCVTRLDNTITELLPGGGTNGRIH